MLYDNSLALYMMRIKWIEISGEDGNEMPLKQHDGK